MRLVISHLHLPTLRKPMSFVLHLILESRGKLSHIIALGEEQTAKNLWKMLCGLDEHYKDADWTGKELQLATRVDREARKANQ